MDNNERDMPTQADGDVGRIDGGKRWRFTRTPKSLHHPQQAKVEWLKPLWAYFQYASKYPDALGIQELQYIGNRLDLPAGAT